MTGYRRKKSGRSPHGAIGDQAGLIGVQTQGKTVGRGKILAAQIVFRQKCPCRRPVRHKHRFARHGVTERVAAVAQGGQMHSAPRQTERQRHGTVRRVFQPRQEKSARRPNASCRQHDGGKRDRIEKAVPAHAHLAVLQQLQPVDRAAQHQRQQGKYRAQSQSAPAPAEGKHQHDRRADQLHRHQPQPRAARQIARHGICRARSRAEHKPTPSRTGCAQSRRSAQECVVHQIIQGKYQIQINRQKNHLMIGMVRGGTRCRLRATCGQSIAPAKQKTGRNFHRKLRPVSGKVGVFRGVGQRVSISRQSFLREWARNRRTISFTAHEKFRQTVLRT